MLNSLIDAAKWLQLYKTANVKEGSKCFAYQKTKWILFIADLFAHYEYNLFTKAQ